MFVLNIKYFISQLKLCTFISSVPFQYDPKQYKLRNTNCKKQAVILQLQFVSNFAYVMLMCYHTVFHPIKEATLTQKLLGYGFLSAYFSCLVMRSNFIFFSDQIVTLVNAIINFEKRNNYNRKNCSGNEGFRGKSKYFFLIIKV